MLHLKIYSGYFDFTFVEFEEQRPIIHLYGCHCSIYVCEWLTVGKP